MSDEQEQKPEPGPEPEPEPRRAWSAAGFGCLGTFVFVVVNIVLWLLMLNTGLTGNGPAAVSISPLILTVLTFIVGGVLCFRRDIRVKALGIGLMIGWAVLTVVSSGMCTGIQPGLYS